MGVVLSIFVVGAILILLAWCLFGLLLLPVFGAGTVTLCYCQGKGEELEQTVRAFGWLRDSKKTGGRLVLVDCGLDAEGLQLAQLLRKDHPWVDYCPRPALEDYLDLTDLG